MSYLQSFGMLCKQSQKHRITSHSRRLSGLPLAAGKKIVITNKKVNANVFMILTDVNFFISFCSYIHRSA